MINARSKILFLSTAFDSTPTEFLMIYRHCKSLDEIERLANAYLQKCCSAPEASIAESLKFACQYDLAPEYFRAIANLAILFMTAQRSASLEWRRVKLVASLLRRDPGDTILQHPAAHDFEDPWRVELSRMWMDVLSAQKPNVRILKNAATFFANFNLSLSRRCLSKCSELEPNNPYWQQLAQMYFHTRGELGS